MGIKKIALRTCLSLEDVEGSAVVQPKIDQIYHYYSLLAFHISILTLIIMNNTKSLEKIAKKTNSKAKSNRQTSGRLILEQLGKPSSNHNSSQKITTKRVIWSHIKQG